MDKIAIGAALQKQINFCMQKMSEPDLEPVCEELSNKVFWGKELAKFQSAYEVAKDFKWE